MTITAEKVMKRISGFKDSTSAELFGAMDWASEQEDRRPPEEIEMVTWKLITEKVRTALRILEFSDGDINLFLNNDDDVAELLRLYRASSMSLLSKTV